MPTIPGRFDSYKLDTEFGDGYCIHTRTTPESEDMRGTWRDDLRIGQGGFGSVFRQKKEGDATFRAVKKVFKKDIKWNERELLALTKLRVYPQHFVKFFGWFEDEVHETIYFAMEYAQYGDLERYINGSEMPVPEYDVKTITAQILEGLVIMHRENICHRDLKPQNILVVSRSPDPIWVKITDFGVSKQAGENTQLRTEVGTCNYTAPEVLGYLSRDTSVYTSAVDIWSLGCLVYTIMTKESPFSTKGIIKYISNEILPEEKLTERYASSGVIEFIIKLLKPQPYDRLSAEDALKDRWLSANTGELCPTEPPGIFVEKVSSRGSSLSSGASVHAVSGTQTIKHVCHTLYCAIKDSDWAALTRLCQDPRVNVNAAAGKNGNKILLHMITENGNEEVMELLLEKGATIDATDGEQYTALHWVAHRGHHGMAKLLLKKGANKDLKNIYGSTALHLAAAKGSSEIVELLLESGVDIMSEDEKGNTALHLAILKGHESVVEPLLRRPQLKEKVMGSGFGKLAVHFAAREGYEGVVRVLLESGVDIMTKDEFGSPILHTAVKNRHEDLVGLLLDKNADIEGKDMNGYTALHLAADDGSEPIVGLLLRRHANISAKHKNGYTALHLAVRRGHFGVVSLLVANGADIYMKDKHGNTPLQKAISRGHEEVIMFLLSEGADSSARYERGFTALHLAADMGHDRVVKLLLSVSGINIEAKDDHAFTALHLAAAGGHEVVVKVLLENGANILAKHVAGSTALHIAARDGHEGIVRLLIGRAIEIWGNTVIEEKDQQGYTACQLAKHKGHDNVVSLIVASRPPSGVVRRLSMRVRPL